MVNKGRRLTVRMQFLLVSMTLLLFFFIRSSSHSSEVKVEKFYNIGEEKIIKPNGMIAGVMITVGEGVLSRVGSTNINYLGRESESSIQLEVCYKELKGSDWVEKPRTQHKVFLKTSGYTIFEIEGLTLRLKPSDNNLLCTVVGDWDSPYKKTIKICSNNHKWEQKDYNFCPTCGLKLKEVTNNK